MFDWSDTVFRRRNVTRRRISNTVLQPRYWGREADPPEVCRLLWVFGWVSVAHLFSCLCCPVVCVYVLSSVLWCPLRFPHKTMFGSTLPPVVCRRAHVLLWFVCMFAYIDVQHFAVAHLFSFLCFVFCFIVFVLCRMCLGNDNLTWRVGVGLWFFSKKIFWFPMLLKKIFWFWWRKKK